MPRLLKDLQINDVSSVDRGAGRGVKVMLMKRDSESPYTSVEKNDLPDAVVAYLKREFTAEQRQASEDKGHAMSGGGYPIENKSDLKNAIQAVGRAKNPGKTKAHIKSRAKALGASDMIPDNWEKRDADVIDMTGLLRKDGVKKDAIDFETASDNIEAQETASDIAEEMNECICALNCAICSIIDDPEVTDKAAAIAESFSQFKDYIAGLSPDTLEKTMNAEVKKMIDDAVAAALKDSTDQIAKLQDENSILKLSPEAQEFCKAMSPEDKKKFAAKDKKDQEEDMADAKKRAAAQIDPSIQKRLAEADEDRKILKALQEKDEISTFAKRAKELDQPEEFGEVLRKAHHGDAAALKTVEDTIGAMNKAMKEAQRTGKIFKEFGSQLEKGGATPLDQLNAKAAELRKTEAGKELSEAQAFAKVYEDPANAELAKAERDQRNKQMGVAA